MIPCHSGKTIPCQNCDKRVSGCHSSCEDYLNFRKHLDNISKEKKLAAEYWGYSAKIVHRRQRELEKLR